MNRLNFEVFYLLGNILYNRFKSRIHDPVRWMKYFIALAFSKYKRIYSLPHCFINFVLMLNGFSGFSDNTLIIGASIKSFKWFKVVFNCRNNYHRRDVQILFCKFIPSHVILCSEQFIFNLKKSLGCFSFERLNCEIYIHPHLHLPSFETATVIKVSPIETNGNCEPFILEKAMNYFLKKTQYCHRNDILCINLNSYSPFCINKNVYLMIKDITLESDYASSEGFVISEETFVYQLSNVNSFLPPVYYLLVDNLESKLLTPVVPSGLENHYNILFKWFTPFFCKSVKGLLLKKSYSKFLI